MVASGRSFSVVTSHFTPTPPLHSPFFDSLTAFGFVTYHSAFFGLFTTVLAFAFVSSPSSGPYYTVVLYALPFTFCGSADFDHFGNHVICPYCNSIAAVF